MSRLGAHMIRLPRARNSSLRQLCLLGAPIRPAPMLTPSIRVERRTRTADLVVQGFDIGTPELKELARLTGASGIVALNRADDAGVPTDAAGRR